MPTYTFSFQTADYTLDGMDTVNKAINASLTDLETSCEQKLQEWLGSARDEYYAAKTRWHAAANAMVLALENARATLFTISEGYGSAEQRATQIWANTHTGI